MNAFTSWLWHIPTSHEWLKLERSPWRGWRAPLVYVACDRLHHTSWFANRLRWHRRVHHDFDRDLYVYAWWPIAPFAKFAYWWSARRWCVERALRHRILDGREGSYLWEYTVRPLRAWTWRKTRSARCAMPNENIGYDPEYER